MFFYLMYKKLNWKFDLKTFAYLIDISKIDSYWDATSVQIKIWILEYKVKGFLLSHANTLYMEASEPKCVNSDYIIYGVISLMLGDLYIYSQFLCIFLKKILLLISATSKFPHLTEIFIWFWWVLILYSLKYNLRNSLQYFQ